MHTTSTCSTKRCKSITVFRVNCLAHICISHREQSGYFADPVSENTPAVSDIPDNVIDEQMQTLHEKMARSAPLRAARTARWNAICQGRTPLPPPLAEPRTIESAEVSAALWGGSSPSRRLPEPSGSGSLPSSSEPGLSVVHQHGDPLTTGTDVPQVSE